MSPAPTPSRARRRGPAARRLLCTALAAAAAWAAGACSNERDRPLRDPRTLIHEGGILDPGDEDFHGRLLAREGYDFELCADCHGADFSGGPAGVACTTCHEDGPTACTTCHGALTGGAAGTGAHAAHLGPAFDAEQCRACHLVPTDYRDPGHIFTSDGASDGQRVDPAPAEVRFGALAGLTPDPDGAGGPGYRAGPATYDAATGTCRNVYCHGDVLGDAAAALTTPRWTGGADQAACGTCHGLPPADHADDGCSVCHGDVIAADGSLIAPARHVDGVVDTGSACNDCHGSAASPAPPPDLHGRTGTGELTVGAHRSHVTAAHRLRGPVPCGDCHQMPAAIDSPGHIDSGAPAEVFETSSPGASFAGLAAAGGAAPAWDRAQATCSDVYCHGGGAALSGDQADGLVREPVWTAVGAGQAACGTCHGIPPDDGIHAADLPLTSCSGCHPSVDPYGNIIILGPPGQETSEHIDGYVDIE